MRRTTLIALLAPLGFLTVDTAYAAKAAANAPLLKLFDATWQEDLADDPLSATALGDPRYNDKLPDMTQAAIDARQKKNYTRLQALNKIKREKLDKADQLNYDLFQREIKTRIGEYQFKPWMFALTPGSGPQQLAEVAEFAPFNTVKDYDNWIARINASGPYIDQWIVLLTQGTTEKLTQPRIIINKVLEQLKGPLTADVEANPFYAPFQKMPAGVPDAEKARLQGAAKAAIQTVAIPAFQRFDKFLREVYLPASRDTVGIYDIPGGDQYYRNRINYYTTVENLDAVRIHNLGQEEVKRIRAEMEKTLEGINFLGTLDQFLQFIRTDSRFFYKSGDELFAAYEKTARGIEPQLPKLFGRLPKNGFDIRPIPAATAPTTTTAYYQPGSLDGTRRGAYYVNLYKPETRPKWEVEALTAHESVPGHHLQIALSYELPGLPNFRRNADYTAFIEGWALYSEKLGYQLGLYQDDFSKFGQLNYEMWRAVRLVVDTGMHSFKWTRDQAVYFFKQNTGKSDLDINNEIDRYIAWPGQALAYKVGQLRIQALREEAEKALGERFDVRAFHDKLLGMGPLPLAVLDTEMRSWIAEQSARR
ncbi:MAG TPA: DUF885 domain-containing protein [Steroidobacteraceae bacterium]|nr:DUF885 domain-containing protein [Steroidobacteraceae bacterium]